MSFDDYIAQHLMHILIPKLGRAYSHPTDTVCTVRIARSGKGYVPIFCILSKCQCVNKWIIHKLVIIEEKNG